MACEYGPVTSTAMQLMSRSVSSAALVDCASLQPVEVFRNAAIRAMMPNPSSVAAGWPALLCLICVARLTAGSDAPSRDFVSCLTSFGRHDEVPDNRKSGLEGPVGASPAAHAPRAVAMPIASRERVVQRIRCPGCHCGGYKLAY